MKKPVLTSLAVAVLAMAAFGAHAADANVTNNVIFGSGVTNGNFTVGNGGGVEIGLRARVRFDAANQPTNDNASNGDGTYNVPVGNPAIGFSWMPPGSPSTAKWNFDWSVNTDPTSQSTGQKIDDYTYLIYLDFDPSFGTNYLSFDPIKGLNAKTNTMLWDHGIGNNGTAMGDGLELNDGNAANAGAYATAIGANNLVQNSWNYEFFDSGAFPFNASTNGNYTIRLEALSGRDVVSFSQIDVIVGTGYVPEPGSLALVGLALGGLAFARRRKVTK